MEMTLQEAWTDFLFGLHQSGKWETLKRPERQYIDRANRMVRENHSPVKMVCGLFKKHAPGVYTMLEIKFHKKAPLELTGEA